MAVSVNNSPFQYAHKFHPRIQVVMEQLDALAPRFELGKGDVEILNDPEEFYCSLKEKILKSKKRVFLSSLYIGKTQDELIECLSKALDMNEDLKVYILTDYLRSTRESPGKCPASLLSTLVEKFGHNRVDIRLYHTPHLKGIEKALLPKRINEGWGLQHAKLYGFDDEIILSGANLSEDYFTNRQDRYYIFKDEKLTNYYFNIQKALSSLSYQLFSSKSSKNYRLSWPSSNKSSEPHLNIDRYIKDATFLLTPLLKQHFNDDTVKIDQEKEKEKEKEITTVVYPISQFTPLLKPDQSTEKPAILRLLTFLDLPTIKWTFTAGYFNMHPDISEKLLNSTALGNIITASPQANSFYKSKGISKYLPDAYLYLTRKFLKKISKFGKQKLIKVYEWQNGIVNTPNGWSYHAKGIWITCPEEKEPSITVVGSSNYTRRAYSLDLESNAILITRDETLKKKMANEINNLMQHTSEIKLEDFNKEERKISLGVVIATSLLAKKL